MDRQMRLDKFLADGGAGTRSEVKKFIQKGQVRVNGSVVRRPETKISVPGDQVCLGESVVGAAPEFVYYLLHKPAGCVSATEDMREKTVMDYVPDTRKGLFPVGRLDKDTEGLLLITDDGALAHRLLSPKKHVDKTYYALVDGKVTPEDAQAMESGVDIGEKKKTLPAKLEILKVAEYSSAEEPELPDCKSGWISEIRLTICEGKFHQVKRMMEAVGKKVVYLRRISMGGLSLPSDLQRGECRALTQAELEELLP